MKLQCEIEKKIYVISWSSSKEKTELSFSFKVSTIQVNAIPRNLMRIQVQETLEIWFTFKLNRTVSTCLHAREMIFQLALSMRKNISLYKLKKINSRNLFATDFNVFAI